MLQDIVRIRAYVGFHRQKDSIEQKSYIRFLGKSFFQISTQMNFFR